MILLRLFKWRISCAYKDIFPILKRLILLKCRLINLDMFVKVGYMYLFLMETHLVK